MPTRESDDKHQVADESEGQRDGGKEAFKSPRAHAKRVDGLYTREYARSTRTWLCFGSSKYQLEMETSPFMLIPAPRSYPKVRIVLHSSDECREDVAFPTRSLLTSRAHAPLPRT